MTSAFGVDHGDSPVSKANKGWMTAVKYGDKTGVKDIPMSVLGGNGGVKSMRAEMDGQQSRMMNKYKARNRPSNADRFSSSKRVAAQTKDKKFPKGVDTDTDRVTRTNPRRFT